MRDINRDILNPGRRVGLTVVNKITKTNPDEFDPGNDQGGGGGNGEGVNFNYTTIPNPDYKPEDKEKEQVFSKGGCARKLAVKLAGGGEARAQAREFWRNAPQNPVPTPGRANPANPADMMKARLQKSQPIPAQTVSPIKAGISKLATSLPNTSGAVPMGVQAASQVLDQPIVRDQINHGIATAKEKAGIAQEKTPFNFSKGGSVGYGKGVQCLREGGPVIGPGTETSDSIPAQLPEGTFIIPADAAKAIGYEKLMELKDAAEVEDTQEEQAEGGREEVPAKISNGEFEFTPEEVEFFGGPEFFEKLVMDATGHGTQPEIENGEVHAAKGWGDDPDKKFGKAIPDISVIANKPVVKNTTSEVINPTPNNTPVIVAKQPDPISGLQQQDPIIKKQPVVEPAISSGQQALLKRLKPDGPIVSPGQQTLITDASANLKKFIATPNITQKPALNETSTVKPALNETSTVKPALNETSTVKPALSETPASYTGGWTKPADIANWQESGRRNASEGVIQTLPWGHDRFTNSGDTEKDAALTNALEAEAQMRMQKELSDPATRDTYEEGPNGGHSRTTERGGYTAQLPESNNLGVAALRQKQENSDRDYGLKAKALSAKLSGNNAGKGDNIPPENVEDVRAALSNFDSENQAAKMKSRQFLYKWFPELYNSTLKQSLEQGG